VPVATADHVLGLPFADVLRVAHPVGFTLAAVGAEYLDLIANLGELEVRMAQLGPPESDRPPGRGRHRRLVSGVFLHIGEAGDRLACDERQNFSGGETADLIIEALGR
jgi:hypothetical protein